MCAPDHANCDIDAHPANISHLPPSNPSSTPFCNSRQFCHFINENTSAMPDFLCAKDLKKERDDFAMNDIPALLAINSAHCFEFTAQQIVLKHNFKAEHNLKTIQF
jgi:hypothetical protein